MRPPAGGRQYIYWYPFLRPSLHPYLGNVAKLIRRRRISLKRDNPPLKSLRQKHGARICAKARGFIKTLFLATATSSPRLYLRIRPRIASRAAHCIATSSPHPVQRIGLQLQPDHRAQRIASQLDHRAQSQGLYKTFGFSA